MKLVFKTEWSEENKEFVGTCEQFPSLSYLDVEEHLALAGILDKVSDALLDSTEIELEALKERSKE